MIEPYSKIIFLIPTLELGGAECTVVNLAENFRKYNYDAEIWLTSRNIVELDTNLKIISNNIYVSSFFYNFISRIIFIIKNIKIEKPNLIISFLESSSIPGIVAALIMRIPIIVSIRGNPKRFNFFYKLMTFSLYRYAKAVVIPSEDASKYYSNKYYCNNICVIPNWVDIFSANIFHKANTFDGPFIAVGRLVKDKNFLEVIKFATSLDIRRQLIIVGDGPDRVILEAYAKDKKLNILFMGSMPHVDVLKLISESSFLISMSNSECWPNVIMEALALGTPVIAKDIDYGPREMITSEYNGFLVQSTPSAEDLSLCRKYVNDSNLYSNLSDMARVSSSKWNKENILNMWFSIAT